MKKTITKTKLQARVNKLIRERDSNDHGYFVCCSCDQMKPIGQMNAGHFLAVGRCEFLRFYPKNIHGQCISCNNYHGGRLDRYTLWMIDRYGKDWVDRLMRFEHYPAKEVLRDMIILWEMGLDELVDYYEEKIKRVKFN